MTAAFESIANICCCCFGVLSVNMLEGVQHVGPPLSHCFTCKCQAIDKTEERWNGLALLYIIDLGGQSLHILQNMKFSFSPEEVLSNTLVPFALTLILKPTKAQIIKSKPQTDHGQVRESERQKYLNCIFQPFIQISVFASAVNQQIRSSDDAGWALYTRHADLSHAHKRVYMKK